MSSAARWKMLIVLLATMFMSLIGVSIVNVVLPAIQNTLGATESDIQWVLSGYALTFGVVLVAAGRAGDVFGRGVIFLTGLVIFTLASVMAGFAPDATSLNAARFIQGLGSGLLNPQVLGMIQQHFHGAERGRAYGALGTVVGFSVAIGPVLGGFLVQGLGENLGWRSTFLVNVPIGLLAILLAIRWLPRPLLHRSFTEPAATTQGRGNVKPKRPAVDLDPVGCLMLGLSILALMLPFVVARETPWAWWLLPGSMALLGAWILWEKSYKNRGREPMVDLELFKIRSFTLGNIIAGLYFMGVTSVWVLVAVYVQQGQGLSPLEAGLIGLPAALVSAWSSHMAGKYVVQLGRKLVIWGIISALAGLLTTMAVVELHAGGFLSIWWLLLTLSFIGLAQGAIISPNQALTLMDVPVANSGSAGGLMQTSQRIGTAVGIAVITAIFYATQHATGAWHTAMTVGFVAITVMVVLTLVVAIIDQRKGHEIADVLGH
ncbi:MFS transporter [Glutamicibacter sp. MNS18]|uniref:MFS transporter n=1 Tax=Glutamicibacter sp. MNS18 TaxID=2989817 RepID=UPI002236325A|nr:MFS transporter [Glutamicibacter sp. MNS18]MCW4466534.1 MFS transporter [Glutamicibacter sp. MNS18]